MKKNIICLCLLLSLFFRNNGLSQEYMLVDTMTHEPKDLVNYSPDQLVEIKEGEDLIKTFLLLDNKKKNSFLSEEYKSKIKDHDFLNRIFDKESYTKVIFLRHDYSSKGKKKSLTIKTNVYWNFEGYDGLQTFYFILIKEKKWLISWLIF